MARYKVTLNAMKFRCQTLDKDSVRRDIYDDAGSHVEHIHAKNKDEAEEKAVKKYESVFEDGLYYTIDITTDNVKKEKKDESDSKSNRVSNRSSSDKRRKVPTAKPRRSVR